MMRIRSKKIVHRKPRIFFCSDLHLDHVRIIKYCNRPFRDVRQMNRVLVSNWNRAVGKNDIVYFLGDLVVNRKELTSYWLNKLNGRIILIRGNHDKEKSRRWRHHLVANIDGTNFFLTHDPKDIPPEWTGWAVCGHHHNNDLINYPLINEKTKRINVSIELTNYRPVNVQKILIGIN